MNPQSRLLYIFSDKIIVLDHLLVALLSKGGYELLCSYPELRLCFPFHALEPLRHEQSHVRQQNQVCIVFLPALGCLANEILTELQRLGLLDLVLEDAFEAL